jgi:two-component system chemotaxis sensor kinase CheA
VSDDPFQISDELLQDFYAECEEQLSTIRTGLETAAGGDADSKIAALERIYRSMHSFKGNAAIVGLVDAERLAHTAEGLLRRLTREELPVQSAHLSSIGDVAERLDAIVRAFRARAELPDVTDLVSAVDLLAGSASTAAATEGAHSPVETKPAGPAIWTATFRPRPELDEQGVNIGEIRRRLAEVGEIVSAKPDVEPSGQLRFEFTVRLHSGEPDLTAWHGVGVAWQERNAAMPTVAPARPRVSENREIASHFVRVDLSRLDELMRIAGEMVIHRSRLQDRIGQLAGERAALQDVSLGLARSLRQLREAVVRVRLVPMLEIFSRLPFVVRDLTRNTDKDVRLELEGQDTEVDKYLVERLREPLLHLVRNCVSHGTETRAEREGAGKPAAATLRLRAASMGDSVQISIRDDGRGIDAASVAARARRSGLAVPETLDPAALLRLICTPGFSTREEADRAAGRGVGMAVVESTLRELGGTLTLATEPGRFTEFTLRLPLTLSITETFVVSAGPHACAIPQSRIEEVMQVDAADLRTVNGTELAPRRGNLFPLLRLSRLLRVPGAASAQLPVVVLATEEGPLGLVVDRIIGQRDVVVRAMRDPWLQLPGVSGATELGDGRPVLILDPNTLKLAATRFAQSASPAAIAAGHSA